MVEWNIRCACACGLVCCRKSPCGFSRIISARSADEAVRVAKRFHPNTCSGALRCEGPLHGIPERR